MSDDTAAGFATHEVKNQPPPLVDYDLFGSALSLPKRS